MKQAPTIFKSIVIEHISESFSPELEEWLRNCVMECNENDNCHRDELRDFADGTAYEEQEEVDPVIASQAKELADWMEQNDVILIEGFNE